MKSFLFIAYIIFLFLFLIFSYLFIDPNLAFLNNLYTGFAYNNRIYASFLYIVFILVFFIFYGIFYKLIQIKKTPIKDISLSIVASLAILIFSYPVFLSYDIFNYITTAKVLFFYHENPYIVMPIEFLGDPNLSFTHAANKIALYGPVWILLTGIPYIITFYSFIFTLFSFKLFISLFYILSIFLIFRITKNLFSVFLFSLNPLVVVEILVGGHNDIVMMAFVLLAFNYAINKKIIISVLFFVLSVLIKYATIFLLPVFVYLVYASIKRKKVNWGKIFYWSWVLMFSVFLFSFLREEIYPWYAVWFLVFTCLIPNRRIFLYISLAFSFGLLFRYVPFMISGTHAGLTPIIKSVVTFIPPSLVLAYFLVKKLWGKLYYQ
ncbi:MAG: hypothetical protein HYT07_02205 [Candidatus Levybacteria bacterium]|nr:hypothetical protein [Candidatus Levybacteria bacterium]